MQRVLTAALLFACCALGRPAVAAEWGDLTINFVYDGPVPVPAKLNPNKDAEFCGKHNLVDESLTVNKENKGIRDVFCFVYVRRGGQQPAVHPDYEKTANAEIKLDNKGCRFEPHALFLRTTQTLLVGNPDPVGHNTNVTVLKNVPQNLLIPAGGTAPMKFPNEETLPSNVACNIHPWMSAKLMIISHPYGAVSDKDGKLTIKNLPAGEWTFRFWHEKPGFVGHKANLKFAGKSEKWRSGRKKLTIKPGANDFGEVVLTEANFK